MQSIPTANKSSTKQSVSSLLARMELLHISPFSQIVCFLCVFTYSCWLVTSGLFAMIICLPSVLLEISIFV